MECEFRHLSLAEYLTALHVHITGEPLKVRGGWGLLGTVQHVLNGFMPQHNKYLEFYFETVIHVISILNKMSNANQEHSLNFFSFDN